MTETLHPSSWLNRTSCAPLSLSPTHSRVETRPPNPRSGRVLLRREPWHEPAGGPTLAVWDPVADELRELPAPGLPPDFRRVYAFKAAVLCAEVAERCDHLDCRRQPFTVVFVVSHPAGVSAYLYTSEADVWSEPTSVPPSALPFEGRRCAHVGNGGRCAHVGNALYIVSTVMNRRKILKYDLGTREMTVIDPPPMSNLHIVLMTVEGGGLGCITVKGSGLHLWLWEAEPNGDMGWTQSSHRSRDAGP
ncbi:hypothetical protein PVAP13_2KG100700 [Panicum virgatum]|uniref:Uncharacterized protein n=1 Tax=Panicum virgatum TaxID=38727 RepID=A0A8T0VUL9_PANVG|nr:hypothetical protein PVAP13_2KG100700 [Panicum virgatum]